jgi:ascorbate-specific PTS system EIIC-type component UlaA
MEHMEIIVIIIACIVLGFIGMAIGCLGNKKNGSVGFVLGAALGPIGWIIVAVLPPSSKGNAKSNRVTHIPKRTDPLEEFEMKQRVAQGPPKKPDATQG